MSKPKYSPDLCEKLVNEMAKGISYRAFAGMIKVNPKTLYKWESLYEEWAEAKEVATAACLYFWESRGIESLDNPKNFNSVVWYMNMKNRFGWRDMPAEEHAERQTAQVIRLPIEDMKKIVQDARDKK